MQASSNRRTTWLVAAAVAGGLALLALAGGTVNTSGQTPTATRTARATATATAAAPASSTSAPTGAIAGSTTAAAPAGPSPAPTLDNDTAVRTVLPDSVSGRDQLPGKWSRADMPDAPGGYLVFISTIYPIYDGQGGATWYLLVNDLQWDGYEWLIGSPNYQGQVLAGDDIWLAQNLTDITASPSPAGQSWRVFTVAYTADGLVSPTLSRTETVVEMYVLTLTTVWSRVDSLRETDTSNPDAVEQRSEDVNWTFQDLERTGIADLVATVVDTDTITSADGTPSTTTNTTTEIWKWTNGVFVLQGSQPGTPAAPSPAPRPAATAAARTATAAPTPRPTATATASGRPAG